MACIANPHGVVTYLSRGWERFTGNRADDVLDQGYHVVIHPDDLPQVAAKWDAARADEASYRPRRVPDPFRRRVVPVSRESALPKASYHRAKQRARDDVLELAVFHVVLINDEKANLDGNLEFGDIRALDRTANVGHFEP